MGDDDETLDDGTASDLNIIDVHKPTADNIEDECTCGLCRRCTCEKCNDPLSLWLDAILCPKFMLSNLSQLNTMLDLLAHRHSNFNNLVSELEQYRAERQCGVAWPPGHVAYRCHTCSSVVTMALCADCFRNGDHTGHNYNMFKSRSGGACDCGFSIMKDSGVCKRHGRNATKADEPIPETLICIPRRSMGRLVHRLAFQLRRSHVDLAGETDKYLDFLDMIANSGAILRTLMIDAMVSDEIYSSQLEFLSNHSDKEVARTINEGIKKLKRERKGLSTFKLPENWGLKRISAFCDNLEPRCFVDELMFWVVVFEFPQKLVCFLLGFLMDERYKQIFAKAFVNHYPRLVMLLAGVKGETRMRQLRDSFEQLSRRLLQVSVQIYNNQSLTMMLCEEDNTLHTLIYCLRLAIEGSPTEGLRGVLKFNPLCQNNSYTPKVVCCDNPIIRDRYLGSFAEDLNAILDFKDAAILLVNDQDLLDTWLGMLSYFQTMSPYKRELTEHTPYETGPHISVFTVEADFCLTPLWSMLNRLKGEQPATISLLQSLHKSLTTWFYRMDIGPNTVLDPYYMSFHIPLHRMFAATMRHLLFIQNKRNSDICTSLDSNRYIPAARSDYSGGQLQQQSRNIMTEKEFFRILALHPLQALTLYHETRSSMWTRNGLMTINQAVTYVHYAYCYSTVDLDMFLLRYCASKLEPNHFLKLLMTRFHAWKWLSFKSNNLMMAGNNSGDSARSMYNSKFSILPEQITLMVENSLVVLIQLLTLSLHCNISEREQTRQEMIALISVVDRSYSFLIEMLPDRNVAEHNVSDKNFVSLLAELTNYKPAQHGIGGDLRQGCYTLKPEVWDEDYDPMQVQHRFYQKRDYQMSLERFFQHSKLTGKLKKRFHPSTLWPPLKIPRNIANFGQLDLSLLLDCPALVGLVYSIIYKNLYIVDVPDAVMAYAMHLLEMALRKSIDDTSDEKKDGVRKKNHSFTGRYCYSELRSCPSYFGSKGEAQIKGSSLYSAAPSTTSVVSLTQSSKLGCGRGDDEADRREDGLFPVVRHALDLAFDTTWFPFTSVRDNCLVFVENVYSMPPKEFEVMLRYEARCDERSAAAAAAAAVAGKAATSWAPEELIEGDDDVDNDDEDDGEDDLDEDDSGEYEDDNDEVNDEEEDENDDDELDEDDNEDDANDDADVDEEADEEEEEDEHQRRQQDVRRADGLQQRGHLSNVGRLNSGAAAALPPDTDSDGELTELARQHRSYLAGLRGRRHNWFARRGGSSSAGGSGSSSTQDRATNTRSYWFDRLPDVGQAEHPQVATVGGSATSATLGVGSPSSTTSQNLTRTTYTNTNTQSRSMSRQVRSVFSLQPHEQMYWDDEQRASSLAAAAAAAAVAAQQHNREPPVSAVSLDRARGQVSAGHEASGLAESQPMSLVESAADSDSVEMIAVAGNVVEPTGLAAIALAAERLTYEVSPQQQHQQQQPSGNLGASTAPQDHTYSAREVPMELEESSLPPSQSNALSLLPLHHHQLASSSSAGSTTQIYPENLVTERRAILASDPRPMIAGSAQPLALELPRSAAAAAAAERNSSSSSSAAALAQMSQLTRLQQPSMQSRHNPATTSAAATTSSERQPQPQSGASQLSEVDIHARFMGFFQGGANGSGGGARLDARSSSRAFRQRPTARRGGYRAGPVAPFAVHNPNSVSAAASAAAALAAVEAPTSPPTQTASNSMHLLSQIQQLQHRQRTPAQQDATNAAADDAAPGSSSAATVQPPQPPPSSRIRICANAIARRSNLTGNNLASAASAAYTLLNRSAILKRRGHRYSHSLGRQDQRRTLRRKDRLHQGESLLSLLLRLHAKYSQRPNSFQYNELRAKENLQLNRSRIGDGLHFVNIVLDLICNLDRNHRGGRMRATLERLQDLIWPSDKAVSTAASSASKKKEDKSEEVAAAATAAAAAKCDDIGIDIKTNSRPNSPLQPPPPQQPEACQPGAGSSHSSSEQQQQHQQQQQQQRPLSPNERRRKAKEFQRRLMADFASKQRAFIEKYEAREQPLSDKVAAATSALPDEEPINLSSKLDRPTSDGDRDKRQQPASSSSSSSLPATTQQQQQSPRQLDKRVSMESEQQQPPAADEWLSAETSGPSTSSTTSHPECCICGLSGPADLANPLGQVVLLQSSSVWGHSHLEPAQYRPLPCEEAVQVSLKERTYAKYLERRIDLLCEHFSQFSWLDSINIGAEGGVHVQSCGHYLHIECHQSYIKSLDQEDRLRARTDTDEFLCPVCRQLANSVLPILSNSCFGASGAVAALPGSLSAAQEKPSTVFSLDEQVEQVAALLSRRLTPNQKELHSSAAFCSHLTKATGPQYRLVRSCEPSMHSLFLFLTSIARTNLETELVVRHTVRQQGYVSALVAGSARRSCFQLLFRVLALNAQTLINDQWFTCDHIWSHLTHRVDEKNRLSVKPLNSEVPLLLRDPTAMLLQFLFAIPQPLCKATNFTCLVQILFNLAAVQSIALLLSYLSADTFQALLLEPPETTTTTTTTTSTTKPTEQQGPENNLRALVSLVARNLAPLLRHREQPLANPAVRSRWPLFDPTCQIDDDQDDDDNDDGDDIYCAPTPIRLRTDNEDDDDQVAVQWPVLQTLIKLALLPYLRAASLLQHHLHPTQPYPSQLDEPRNASAIELDFRSLVTCLRLTSGGDENNSQMHLEEALSSWWPRGERDALLADWCGELMRFGAEFSIAARSLLVCRPLAWHRPALMRLPEAFDDVFMFYYRKKCSLCQQVPKDVAVCLVCGAPICFRVSCCKDRSRSRQVHSQHCGANTAVFLAVHTSSIVVIRGSRACVWGSVYLDAHDEEDNGLQRGKPLYLVQARFALLQEQWLTHSFDHTCGKRWIYLQENQ